MKRKKIIAIIGGGAQTCTQEACDIAFKVGKLLIENGFRVISGGYGGIMEAVSKGARSSKKHQDGDIIGVIQSLQSTDANEYCDIVIATGMSYARNQIITASADAVVAIGGGSGTLSEIAFSWQLNKKLFAFKTEGWSGKLAGKTLDTKRNDIIIEIETPEQLIKQLNLKLR